MNLHWWEIVGVPLLLALGSGFGWVMRRRDETRKEDRADAKEQRSEDRALLASELQSLRAELKEVTPQLGNLRHEYAEAVRREVVLLDEFRKLSAAAAQAEEAAVRERERLKTAIRVLHKRVRQLRRALVDNGIPVPTEPVLAGEEEETYPYDY